MTSSLASWASKRLAVEESAVPELQKLADIYETEMFRLGKADGTGILKVTHHGEMVCKLDNRKLHEAPRRHMTANWTSPKKAADDEIVWLDNYQAALKEARATGKPGRPGAAGLPRPSSERSPSRTSSNSPHPRRPHRGH